MITRLLNPLPMTRLLEFMYEFEKTQAENITTKLRQADEYLAGCRKHKNRANDDNN